MNDFPDWLSPILVKELRQGLRSRAFVGLFIALQVIMALVILMALLPDSRTPSTVLFWAIVGSGFIFFLPVRGLGVVASELKGQTMELISLTELSPWRIVVGKWVAQIAQTALFLCSILPYVGLRYFLGEVDLLAEMKIVGLLFLGSLVLTAITVGMSALFTNHLYTVGLIVMGVMLPYASVVVFGFLFNDLARSGSRFSPHFLWLLAPWVALLFMEVSTTKISPAGEGRHAYRRLLGLGLVGTCALLRLTLGHPAFFAPLAGVLILPLLMIEITAVAPAIPALYRAPRPLRFHRIPLLRQVTRWLSEPGWVRGMSYSLLMLAAVLAIALPLWKPEHLEILVVGLGTFLMPLLIIDVFKSIRQKTGFYFSVQVLLFVASLPFTFYAATSFFATFNPATVFWTKLIMPAAMDDVKFLPAIGVTLLIGIFLGVRSVRQRPQRLELRRKAAELPNL